ncbi:Staphylococcal nuclease homologue [Leishmania donovani]|uniref:Staphylococcal_nuclease_homologue_putative/Pfam:P F00565 n=1 Tax=Leishmania donovani TaxID=5661 RepID=A0A0R6XPA3_LEIDO|nr:hypothetical protein [Leishmania donovani]TPP49728.1 hypothetical protein CGC20_19850 [Leishmania donovani]CAJ1986209.1 Staphylococcal nuclease homologue [Leishmania donovani]VDZ42109.1 Staphylococcal_nuclease_homologue_putative/Pfam:PF00565 [Leishmania donovani]
MGNSCCRDEYQTAGKSAAVVQASLAFFDALPPDAQEATVDHVYDGDTLTIREHNRMRVRLLGIDAPELKEREPYAKEAADYVKRLCPENSKVWLKTPHGGEKDRYNRMLSLVFVSSPSGGPGFVCVNIAIVEQGLGTFYSPAGSQVDFRGQLLKAQQSAMQRKVNMWKKQNLRKKVFCTPKGIAFHTSDCLTIQQTSPRNLQTLSAAQALSRGYSPCRVCKPQR